MDDVISALGGLLLVAALVGAIMSAWDNPDVEARNAIRQGSAMLSNGDYAEAVSLFENTLPRYDSPDLRLNLSYGYLARRDGERAVRQGRAAVAAARKELQPAALAQLGRALAFHGQREEALGAWQQAVAAASGDPGTGRTAIEARSSLWHSGMLHWHATDWPAARASFEALLADDTYDDIYSQSAAFKLAQLSAPTDAPGAEKQLNFIQNSLSQPVPVTTPSHILNLRVPGLTEGIPQDEIRRASDELLNTLTSARAFSSGGPEVDEGDADLFWGSYYLRQGESRLAEHYLERAVDARPDSAPALARLGLVMLMLGEDEAAFDHLRRAAELAPSDPLPHYALVQVYLKRQDWQGAESEFAILRSLAPNSVELYMQQAEYHRLRGDYERAEEAYLDAVAAQQASPTPDTAPGASVADPALTLARFYTDVRGLGCEKGLPAGRQAAALHPNDPAAHDAVGWALVICREPEAALIPLDQAVSSAPEVPRYRYHRAKAYSLLARYDDARAEYRRVVNLDPTGPWEQLALTDLVALPRVEGSR